VLPFHLSKNLEKVSKGFKGSDPYAWVVLILATCSLAVILAVIYFR
jgi:hypothetical protein